MADFDKNVNIDVKVKKNLGALSDVADELQAAAGALEGLDERLDDFEEDASNVDIRISDTVKWGGGGSNYTSAIGNYNAKIEALEQSGSLQEIEPKISGEVDASALQGFDGLEDITGDVDEAKDLIDTVNNLNESLNEQREIAEETIEAKDSLEEAQEALEEQTKDTDSEQQKEADSFRDALDGAEGLAQAKDAATKANRRLSDADRKGTIAALEEAVAMEELGMTAEELAEDLGILSQKEEEFAEASREGSKEADIETRSVKELASSLDSDGLAGAKEAATKANRKLGSQTRESVDALQDEFDVSESTARSLLGVSESTDKARRASRRLRNSTDELSDSMRAANKVGGLFEDGLGSLSVNLGAFTVALRNFLTQVPLLMAALGSLGSAAIGVAGAFATAGTAIGSAIGAGAIVSAQNLQEEFSQIEDTGQAIQAIMNELKNTFLEAFEPLTSRPEVLGIFRQVIEGAAQVTGQFADAFAQIMPEIDALVDEMGDRLRGPITELTKAVTFMFRNLKDEFVDITVGVVDALSSMTRFTTKFADGITDADSAVSQFFDTLREMAEFGATMFEGLEPVFIAFASILEGVVSVINSMNAEFVASAITLAVIIGALNRFGGVIGSVIGVIPNFIAALKSADGSTLSLAKSAALFIRENDVMLTGLTAMVEALEDVGDEMDLLNLKLKLQSDAYDDLDEDIRSNIINLIEQEDSIEDVADTFSDMALAGQIVTDGLDELNKEMAESIVRSMETNDQFDEMQDNLYDVAVAAETADSSLDGDQQGEFKFGRGRTDPGAAAAIGAGAGVDVATPEKGATGAISKTKNKLGDIKSKGLITTLTSLATRFATLASSAARFIPPLMVLTTLIGALAVGVIGNLDSVMEGLSATFNAIGAVTSWLAGIMMDLFITTWNAIVDAALGVFIAVKPLIDMFKALAGPANDSGSAIDTLVAVLEYMAAALNTVITATGLLIRVLGTFVNSILTVVVSIILMLVGFVSSLVDGIFTLTSAVLEFILAASGLGSVWNGFISTTTKLIDILLSLPEIFDSVMDDIRGGSQDVLNDVIESFNTFIEGINELPGVNFGKIDKVDFGTEGAEGARVSREEVSEGTDEMMEGVAGQRDPTLNFEEDNSTNVEQSIDADPEEKESLKRTVKDAMEEANSFERRRQTFGN